jgi:hypothetical protein
LYIEIGVTTKMLTQDPLPASMFALRKIEGTGEIVTPGVHVSWSTIERGQAFAVTVRNISPVQVTFRAGLQGYVVR